MMGSLTVSGHPLVSPRSGQRKHMMIRTRTLSLSSATDFSSSCRIMDAVISGHVDHSRLLVILCTSVDRILDILRRWLRLLCQGELTALSELDSTIVTRPVKPLPDLLKDLPTSESTHVPRQPDILKVTELAAQVRGRSDQRPALGHLRENTFQDRPSLEGSLRRRGHFCFRTSMGGPAPKMASGRPLGAPERNAAGDVIKGQAIGRARPVDTVQPDQPDGQGVSQNTQNVTDIVRALRELGDNLDISMRNHKEPAVQAIFGGNAQPWASVDLIRVIRQDVLIRVVGTSLKLALLLWRL
ncbi:hypothetical protein Btru_056819 [Bulinus truncatus]|nr:hypothetical protein Btru_056819 [Bulinus truncatus]